MNRPAGAGQESRDEELEQSANTDDAAAGTGPVKRPGRRDGDDGTDEGSDKGPDKGRRRSRRERERSQREALARARRERTRKARADLAAKAKGAADGGATDPGTDTGEPARTADDRDGKAKGERPKKEVAAASDPGAKERRPKPKAAAAKPDPDGKAGGKRKRLTGAKSDPATTSKGGRKRPTGAESDPGAESKGERPGAKRNDGKRRSQGGATKRERERPKPRAKGGARLRGADKRPGDGRRGRKRGSGAKRAGAGAKRAGAGALVALKRGAAETATRARKAAPKLGGAVFGLIVSAFAIFFTGLGFVLRGLIAVYLRIAPPVTAVLRLTRRAIDAASRQVTPARVLAAVVAGAAVLLALSQFADYRNISVGNDAYADGLQTVAPAPVRETATTGSAHSYVMVPLAAVALVLLGAALTGRWRLCRLIALVGVVAIAVGLIHDRPTGLDVGDEAIAYTGVEATLLGGFYAQLFSGLLLTLSALLLGRELRLAGAGRRARASRAWRRLQRRNPRVEGASA